MPVRDDPLFTPTEAAVLSGLPLKAVNNAIDKKTVPVIVGERAGHTTRLLDRRALMSLALERRLAGRFVPELRRELFDALAGSPRKELSLEDGFVKVDLRKPRRELAASLRQLRRARHLVVSDRDILGGEPVFRGTRIPVHLIASLTARGATEAELREGYPRLTAEMTRLAPLYAAAYPPRGRPRRPPWRVGAPVRRARRALATIETT
jgi:uncharacterized protein (DUF433 family)